MEPSDLLAHACRVLESLGVAYLVTGSTATIAYGEPRFTNDIDIVLDLPLDRVADFCAGFPAPDFYVSPAAVAEAVRSQRQFNVVHPRAGLKIDFILLTDTPFDVSRRRRMRPLAVLPERTVCFASPEDVILKKLTYYQLGGSDKHLRDIAGVLRIQGAAIDRHYIQHWAERLGVGAEWIKVLAQTEPI